MIRSETVEMTIQEPRDQELGTTMFQNLGVVASRKPSQWQLPPFTSLYHLLTEPGSPQETDLADQDESASRPSCLSPNAVPVPSQTRHEDDRREKLTMLPVWEHNTRIAAAAPPSRSLHTEFEAAGNPTANTSCGAHVNQDAGEQRHHQVYSEKASNFWNYPASFREEQREFPARRPASNEVHQHHHDAGILSHSPEPNTEHQRDAAQLENFSSPAQETPRKMFAYIHKLDQPREFHHQLSDVAAIYRSSHTEPSTPPNLMERITGSGTCLHGTPTLTSSSITGEHEDGASSPNKLWSISPRLDSSTLIWGSVTGNHRPAIQQESDWVLSSMPSPAYHSRAAADITQGFMQRQEPRASMVQTEDSAAQGNSGNVQRGALDWGLQNPVDHTRYTISEPAAHLSPHTPGPQYYYQGSRTSTLLADLQGQISNTALLQRLTACNPDPFRLDADQESLTQQSFTSNSAMSHHVRNFDVNQSIILSPSPLDVQNDKAAAAISPHCSSEKGSHDVVTFDSHSCDMEPGAPSACQNTSKNDATTPAGGKVGMVFSRRLSTLRMEMRKGSLADKIDEPPPKQKRKKVRCKVLRDKTKPRVRKGQKTASTKDTANNPTNLEGDENQVLQDVNATGTNAFDSVPTLIVEQHADELICREGHDAIGSLDHGAMVCIDESTSAGSGIPINQKEAAIRAGQLPLSHPGICQLVDFLGLSDEKCHSGDDNLISGDLVISSETHRPLSEESHELVPYDQKVVLPGEQHPHDKNALPLYLFSGETSSSASTELVVANRGLQPATGPSVLQLVLYDQKREIIASRAVRTYKKIRAKVQLDPESQRVWLQLENGGSPEVDTDPDKAKYWEKEREDMKKRVDLFIRKMHFVQGDRRFSRWKGSIVDSVVGAFLTQNVSDHLSSSAFMAVASRFPPARKRENPDPCIGDAFAHKCQEDINGETIPLRLETGFPGSTKEQYPLRSGLESNDSIVIDESTVNDVENSEITDSCKQTGSGKRRICDPQGLIKIGYSCHSENSMTMYDQQSCGKLTRQSAMISSDDERNSICTFDLGGGENRIEDVSEAFRKSCPSRNNKVRRMLRFDNADKQESTSCSISEINKHVGFSIFHETEVASDNISDQQSESESVIGSSSSVLSLQDSNYNLQLTATQDLNYHAEIVQANSQELDAPQVDRNSKKRSLSVSCMSGIERAQLEANQKGRKKNHHRDWESVRREVLGIPTSAKNTTAEQRPRPPDHEDSVNWDAVRLAELGELAETIKERGMHHVLSGRIKAFLTSLYEDHGSIDLEWLRNLSTEMAREYLMSVHGLGVKSVECIRLLTLHHLAFPVDTNVGRICVRLGWVPIEPLPEEVQLHLVELYPIQETIQKYLWPRLCTLDQRTLYELHYQLITFGKVFCTKSKPNCNACPLRTECKHFASAYASAKPLLTGPKEDKNESISSGAVNEEFPALNVDVGTPLLDYPQEKSIQFTWSHEAPIVSEIETSTKTQFDQYRPSSVTSYSENFYVEMPASPEQTYGDDLMDIEDMGANMYIYKNYNDYSLDLIGENISVDESGQSLITINDELTSQEVRISHPTIPKTATFNLPPSLPKSNDCSPHWCCNNEITSASHIPSCESKCNSSSNVACTPTHQTDIVEISENAIVAVPEAAQIPAPKLKNVGRLRTIHYVYEIPDDHCLLKSVDPREKDDPCSYLLAIWSPGETPGSQQDIDEYCRDEFSLQSSNSSSGDDETVAGTLLIPCRTAMHGNFPLNGTYFQVNEVFADHESSMNPLQVPRSLIWSLRRRFVYFGTSVPNIFKGLSTDEIKDCFWRGFVCVRGFDRQSRAPKPLVCRLHFPISKQPQKATKQQRKKNDEK